MPQESLAARSPRCGPDAPAAQAWLWPAVPSRFMLISLLASCVPCAAEDLMGSTNEGAEHGPVPLQQIRRGAGSWADLFISAHCQTLPLQTQSGL